MKSLMYGLCVIIISGLLHKAVANDQELYDAKLPADTSFIRFINATPQPLAASGGGVAGEAIAPFTISPYYITNGGEQSYSLNSITENVTIAPARYYTVIMRGESSDIIKDTVIDDPSKAGIYFYNASNMSPLALYADKHGIAIFDDVATGAGVSREINPLSLELSIRHHDKKLSSLEPVLLQRRSGYSIIAFGTADTINVVQLDNAIQR